MGGGHHHLPKIPDWKIYKVDDAPKLVAVREKLARKGLTDPWLRNEVWRFDPRQFPSEMQNVRRLLSRGLLLGIALTGVTVLAEKMLSKGDHGHGHGEHH